ncbi:MAG: hypothetical protein JSV62_07400 [Promethearchaeota archaeon]|nr:MAG: hypothetical protein JSV62_07400 [Candidatus Lokiarchaeota archaeon]
MQKSDYIYMIMDNIMVYHINLPSDLQGNQLQRHLNKYDEKYLGIVAGFDKNFLEHFLIISKGKTQQDLAEVLKKMEKISLMIGPTGNLNYLTPNQIQYILTKLGSLNLNQIKEAKISKIADEQIEKEFGTTSGASSTLENQLSSAAFYLQSIGYSNQEITEKFNEVRQDPSKLDALFTLQPKEIYSVPAEIQQRSTPPSRAQQPSRSQPASIDRSQQTQNAIEQHVRSIEHEITGERAKKVEEIIQLIRDHVKDNMNESYERVFRQIHPDRLNRALKMLKTTKRKSKRMNLYLEWFFCSHLMSNIEVKVEHWQTSSAASHGSTGVYTAGINFGRYDQIIREFPDNKLAKVINVARHILQNPSKKAMQKLATDLVAETGFDEHLYFTD